FGLVLAFRYPLNTALTVSASLAQIGEFSFILATGGVALGLLPAEAQSLILAGALISIAANSLVFRAIEPVQAWIRSRSQLARALERREDPLAELPVSVTPDRLTGHAVIIGYGRVGSRIGEALRQRGVTFVVAERNREIVERLRDRGMLAISGDAADPAVMVQTHVARARLLIVAAPDALEAKKMLDLARRLNPLIEAVVRIHTDEEAALFRDERGATVFMGEQELAASMVRHLLDRLAAVEEKTLGYSTVRRAGPGDRPPP
ncbi:MAG TPA: NAD-binding protein, partial [Gemmatimonadales bacterium]|nr:NAD-binding protein [Gemmatimonadales bacterium]